MNESCHEDEAKQFGSIDLSVKNPLSQAPQSDSTPAQVYLEPQVKTKKNSRKLTQQEKKERDRQRKREQALRRRRAEQDLWDQAKLLEKAQQHSSTWHNREREEEELLLLRLDRDAVDIQRSHPAAAGYNIKPSDAANLINWSPVFICYSHAHCSSSQDAAETFRRSTFTAGSSSGRSSLRSVPEAAFWHPSCHGYQMARDDDCTKISPVFFRSVFAKISLDEVAASAHESAVNEIISDEEGSENDDQPKEPVNPRLVPDSERRRLQGIMNRIRCMAANTSDIYPEAARPQCLVCNQAQSTMGCPGCFEFSKSKFSEAESSSLAQRLRTPKTKLQEGDERQARHKFLFLQKQLIIPPLLHKRNWHSNTAMETNNNDDSSGRSSTPAIMTGRTISHINLNEYYLHVLPDPQTICKHRAM